jgi:ectoine hydroxylase-related dioxygenase (phytanoyl-CoA dioxygenase family)
MQWHADSDDAYLEGPVRTERFTFNIPLVDVNDAIAPMEVVPGSHRMHHVETRYIDTIEQNHSVKLLTRRGDCIVRDGNMLHRGTPNLTDRPRIMLDQTYRAVED